MKKLILFALLCLYHGYIFGQIDIKSAIKNPNCGKNDGQIDLCITGGTPPYQYQWSNSQINSPSNSVGEGKYSVTVTDKNGVKSVKQIDVINNKSIDFYANETYPSCDKSKLGSIQLSNLTLEGPYQFFWNTGAITQNIDNLQVGIYSVTVVNQEGCKGVHTIDLKGEINIFVTQKHKCNDSVLVKIKSIVGGTPPYKVEWEVDGAIISNSKDSVRINKDFRYSYTILITDAKGCVGNYYPGTPIEGDSPYYLRTEKNSCSSKGKIYPENSFPFGSDTWKDDYFKWSTGEEGKGKGSISNLEVGRYFVTITESTGCTETQELIVKDDINVSVLTDIPCANAKDASAKILLGLGINPPINYLWSTGAIVSEVKNLAKGIYYATISVGNDCKKIQKVRINSFNRLNVETDIVKNEGCPKVKVIDVLHGKPPYSYLWSNNEKKDYIDFSSQVENQYCNVTVTDSKGCKGVGYKNKDSSIKYFYNVYQCDDQTIILPNCCNTNLKYVWSDGDIGSTKKTLKNVFYTVTITDEITQKYVIEKIIGGSLNNCPSNLGFIQGNIKLDKNNNCQYDISDKNKAKSIIQVLPGPYYGTIDSTGYYKVFLPAGAYQVSSKVLTPYEEFCQNNVNVNLVDSAKVDFISKPIADCPYMSIDISTPFVRRCFDNTYQVKYCNIGTATAKDAYVKITFDDKYLTYKSASVPLFSQNGGVLTFKVGDVAAQKCGNFSIVLNVNCNNTIIGQTHCVEAKIFPDTLCNNIDQPKIVSKAQCDGQNVIFTIKNVGNKTMAASKNYLIIEEEVIYKKGNFLLAPNQSVDIKMSANGKTYRLEAEQENGVLPSKPSAWAEACGKNNQGSFSTGFVTLFGKGDDDSFTSIDCRPSIGAYDPNEKQTYPIGYKSQHFIEKNQDIEYIIDFQNEGTDTAFTVVLRDTLDKSLNVNTLRMTASSHVYDWSLSGAGLLTVTFDKIHLTAKKLNEEKSKGFVKFYINQKADLPLGTIIKNRAGIYFDFNTPIMTNEVFHTIGQNFLKTVSVNNPAFEKLEVNVYPNPMKEETIFDIKGVDFQSFDLLIYDISGKMLRHEKHQTPRFIFQKNGLGSGFYFFQIRSEGKLLSNGKIECFLE